MPTTIAQLLSRAESVIDRLTSSGISVNPGSRLRRYVQHLAAAVPDEYCAPSDDILRKLHRLLIEVDDLAQIVDTLSAPPVTGWDTRVIESLKGGFLRTDESNHSRARDIQFELMVATLLRRSGFEPELAEPDVRATIHGIPIGFAAKRPRSRRKVGAVAKEGAKQIIRLGMQGLLSMDVSVIANPEDKHITSKNSAQTEQFITDEATNIAKYVVSGPAIRYGTDNVFGALVRLTLPVWQPDERLLSFASQWRIVSLVGEDDHRSSVVRELHRGIATAESAG